MAIFKSKKNKEIVADEKDIKIVEKTATISTKKLKTTENKTHLKSASRFSSVLKQPRITEKATIKAENGVYVFEVNVNATKKEIGSAVMHYYKVVPVKVNIVKIPAKKIFSRAKGKKGVKAGGKKAYVYLKKGDKIEVI